MKFLLTRPMRGATVMTDVAKGSSPISTHTPHAGRDGVFDQTESGWTNFYSHAPCGARRV